MAKRKTGKRSGSRQPEALAMLMEDHQKVQKLFKQFEKAEDQQRKAQIAEEACNELTVHAEVEEQIFYPAVRDAIKDPELVEEAEVEHAVAKDLIEKLKGMDAEDDEYSATFKVLGEYVNHHIEEEQNQLFPEVKRAGIDLDAIAAEMREKKQEMMAELGMPMPREEAMAGTGRPASRRPAARNRSAGR